MSTRTYAFLAALTMLLLSGVLYHAIAGDSVLLDEAAARVALVPMNVGDWRGHDEPADVSAFEQTGARGYWVRQYVNQKSNAKVQVILMCGRPGKMAVHTPEVCYSGAGYQLQDEPEAVQIADEQFWTAQFNKQGGHHLRLHWAWNAQGTWDASPMPRWDFRGAPFLYKLYVSREVVGTQADVTAEFMREFTPVLNQTLFSSGS